MAIPRKVQAGEPVGMLDAASMRTKRAKNVLRESKMREERDIVGSTWIRLYLELRCSVRFGVKFFFVFTFTVSFFW